tara:strand:+ start:71995 stop:72696 length:702 start_codon:yes stop_codon:yes gene_type:complete
MSLFILMFLQFNIMAKNHVFAVIDASPYVIVEESKLSGVVVDNFNNCIVPLMNKKGLKVELRSYPFKRAINYLKKGEVEGIYLYIKDRSLKYAYSTKSVFSLKPSICSDQLEKITSKKTSQYEGVRFSHFHGEYPVKELFNSKAKPLSISSDNYAYQALRMLKANRINAIYHPLPAAMEYEKKKHDDLYYDVKCKRLTNKDIPLHVAFQKQTKIYKQMNSVLDKCLPKITFGK